MDDVSLIRRVHRDDPAGSARVGVVRVFQSGGVGENVLGKGVS